VISIFKVHIQDIRQALAEKYEALERELIAMIAKRAVRQIRQTFGQCQII